MIDVLWEQTPYLAGGFAMNLWISALAMLMGTLIGGVLGRIRLDALFGAGRVAGLSTHICRNVPSFVLMFYIAFMLPPEVQWGERVISFPLWIKATLALTFPVIGFVSDQSLAFFRQRRAGLTGAGETFVIAWMQYFLIIIMASATASVIGTDEIVGRANVVIAADADPTFLLVTYLYVSAWFLAAGGILSVLILGVFRTHAQQP